MTSIHEANPLTSLALTGASVAIAGGAATQVFGSSCLANLFPLALTGALVASRFTKKEKCWTSFEMATLALPAALGVMGAATALEYLVGEEVAKGAIAFAGFSSAMTSSFVLGTRSSGGAILATALATILLSSLHLGHAEVKESTMLFGVSISVRKLTRMLDVSSSIQQLILGGAVLLFLSRGQERGGIHPFSASLGGIATVGGAMFPLAARKVPILGVAAGVLGISLFLANQGCLPTQQLK